MNKARPRIRSHSHHRSQNSPPKMLAKSPELSLASACGFSESSTEIGGLALISGVGIGVEIFPEAEVATPATSPPPVDANGAGGVVLCEATGVAEGVGGGQIITTPGPGPPPVGGLLGVGVGPDDGVGVSDGVGVEVGSSEKGVGVGVAEGELAGEDEAVEDGEVLGIITVPEMVTSSK